METTAHRCSRAGLLRVSRARVPTPTPPDPPGGQHVERRHRTGSAPSNQPIWRMNGLPGDVQYVGGATVPA